MLRVFVKRTFNTLATKTSTIDWSVLDVKELSPEDSTDFLKLKDQWIKFDNEINTELAKPIPKIDFQYFKNIILTERDEKTKVVDKWEKIAKTLRVDKNSFLNKEASEENQLFYKNLQAAVLKDTEYLNKKINDLELQRESLMFEKYNLDSMNIDLVLARYPLIDAEITEELDNSEWFIDSGIVDADKGWGALVLDSNGNPTPRPAEVDDHHHH